MQITLVKFTALSGFKKGLPNKIGRPFFLFLASAVLIFGVIFPCSQAMASLSDVDANARKEYNQAVERIYNKILQLKDQYPELQDFSKNAIVQDGNGFDTLTYEYDLRGQYGYRFSIRVEDPQEVASDEYGSRELKFPLLGFKVAIESKRLGRFTEIEPDKIINRHLQDLKVLEQSHLPLRLELTTDKKTYQVKEGITLTISLKNTGSQAFRVADLNEGSLYCEMDNMIWGKKDSKPKLNNVLNPSATLTKVLKIRGISSSKDAWFACTYGLSFKGVRPYSHTRVSIKPAP